MECKGVKAIFAVAAILVLLVGQSSASHCYRDCCDKCRAEGNNPVWWCKYHCRLDCLIPPAAKVDIGCNFACAKSSCGQLAPEGNDMGACLSTCSKSCTKVRKTL